MAIKVNTDFDPATDALTLRVLRRHPRMVSDAAFRDAVERVTRLAEREVAAAGLTTREVADVLRAAVDFGEAARALVEIEDGRS